MAVLTALAIGSLALSAFSAVKQGKAAKQAGKLANQAAQEEAGIIDYNAAIADQQAADAITRGQEQQQQVRAQTRQTIGSQRAGFAASGVDVSSGSAADVQADAAFLGELDALTAETNAAREAWGFKVQATDLRNRADVTRRTGKMQEKAANSAGNAAYVAGAGNVIGGVSNLLSDRYGFKEGRGSDASRPESTTAGRARATAGRASHRGRHAGVARRRRG